jgi:hypothetical protein
VHGPGVHAGSAQHWDRGGDLASQAIKDAR